MTDENASPTGDAAQRLERELGIQYERLRARGLSLDLTRGKPSLDQLGLSADLDGLLAGDYLSADGTDTRGYGGLDGIAEAKALAADWLGLNPTQVVVGGNSSLSLMYLFLLGAHRHGFDGPESAWSAQPGGARFICPVPGYDRHFALCEDLGIELVSVPMTGEGPDMDAVESLVAGDPGIKGMWCVPRYSNPTGETYSDATVGRIASLAKRAGPGFRVMWDDAYAVHALAGEPAPLANVMDRCRAAGTEDSVVLFGSTSKVTFAGAGLAFAGGSDLNLGVLRKRLAVMTIGPDKVNQLRHVRRLRDMDGVGELMKEHAAILGPKFECVERALEEGLGNREMGRWTTPEGGYFVSFFARAGLASEIVRLCAEAGVKLTPAGAAYPYGTDPEDAHIRLAPSYPPLPEVEAAMEVFVTCVKLATVRQALADHA